MIVDAELTRFADDARDTGPVATWVWAELQRTGGQARMMDLAHQSGWSTRHIDKVFGGVTGLSPKAVAQILRFERIHADLGRCDLAELAQRHGLSDQSHLSREVRRYSGESPRALQRARRPTAFTAISAGAILESTRSE